MPRFREAPLRALLALGVDGRNLMRTSFLCSKNTTPPSAEGGPISPIFLHGQATRNDGSARNIAAASRAAAPHATSFSICETTGLCWPITVRHFRHAATKSLYPRAWPHFLLLVRGFRYDANTRRFDAPARPRHIHAFFRQTGPPMIIYLELARYRARPAG